MKLIKPVLTATALMTLAATPLLAQAPGQPPAPPAPHMERMMKHHGPVAKLTVTGEGRATAEPDMAMINVGVSTRGKTAGEAMAENATRQKAVIDALKAQGVEDRDIQTSGLNLSPEMSYSQDGKPPVLTGYAAQNMVTIRVRKLDGLGATLDALVETGANEINSISFTREDMSEGEDEARADAIASARHRAEVMAKAAGMRLGPLMALSDSAVSNGPVPMMAMASRAGDATPIAAGELTLSATVNATYALLPEGEDAPEGEAPEAEAPAAPDAPAGN
ncbi:SIMPL domain-containing protein [Paracoccus sulfuroxidans]|uniref:SIMPL domain-containing protein n=1 Tax=Paracoccus sulfuroxidans TaxID=384678 RepID=A0A562NB59_9RHOB|nr:SIMPL domain-containing protein [Paracoccus sulfuroxidans]TWI29399.1 hypothetical protein IQ24_03607 [Paracoccus sulfuroxidans]